MALDPESAQAEMALGDAYSNLQQSGDARKAYEKSLQLAQTIQPAFQVGTAKAAQEKLEQQK